jgi:hypothetical protein
MNLAYIVAKAKEYSLSLDFDINDRGAVDNLIETVQQMDAQSQRRHEMLAEHADEFDSLIEAARIKSLTPQALSWHFIHPEIRMWVRMGNCNDYHDLCKRRGFAADQKELLEYILNALGYEIPPLRQQGDYKMIKEAEIAR